MTTEQKMATEVGNTSSGNTKPEQSDADNKKTEFECKKRRSFLLTFNEDPLKNVEKCCKKFIKLTSCTYYIACKEFNKKGNLHAHMYVHFKNAYQIPKNLIQETKMHIDVTLGSPKQCIAYIKKEGKKHEKKRIQQKTEIIEEWGEIPLQGTLSIKELRTIKNSDDLPDWKQYNVWKQVQNEHKRTKLSEWKKDIEVIYIQGPSGVGKTLKCKEILESKKIEEFDEVKHIGEFWHNVSDFHTAVYDDFRDSHMKASEFINFIDYNTHNLNVKGSSIRNNYKLIIITSVQPLESIYANMDDEPKQQWMRRIKVIDMYNN